MLQVKALSTPTANPIILMTDWECNEPACRKTEIFPIYLSVEDGHHKTCQLTSPEFDEIGQPILNNMAYFNIGHFAPYVLSITVLFSGADNIIDHTKTTSCLSNQ